MTKKFYFLHLETCISLLQSSSTNFCTRRLSESSVFQHAILFASQQFAVPAESMEYYSILSGTRPSVVSSKCTGHSRTCSSLQAKYTQSQRCSFNMIIKYVYTKAVNNSLEGQCILHIFFSVDLSKLATCKFMCTCLGNLILWTSLILGKK